MRRPVARYRHYAVSISAILQLLPVCYSMGPVFATIGPVAQRESTPFVLYSDLTRR